MYDIKNKKKKITKQIKIKYHYLPMLNPSLKTRKTDFNIHIKQHPQCYHDKIIVY